MPSPLVKVMTAAASLAAVSNVLAQVITAYRAGNAFVLDLPQLLRFLACNLITTPPNHLWQQFLERSFPAYPRLPDAYVDAEKGQPAHKEKPDAAPEPKLDWRNTMTKWFVDCITLGAIVNTVAFLVIMGTLKGEAGAAILHNIKTETIPIIVAGYKIWPFASIVSFSCIPVERRIIFLNCVGLVWGTYMSLVAARV